MQRIIGSQTHSKTHDMQRDYYLNQKKAFEINPRHPLIKELLRRVEDNPDDSVAKVKTSPWISFPILTFCHNYLNTSYNRLSDFQNENWKNLRNLAHKSNILLFLPDFIVESVESDLFWLSPFRLFEEIHSHNRTNESLVSTQISFALLICTFIYSFSQHWYFKLWFNKNVFDWR